VLVILPHVRDAGVAERRIERLCKREVHAIVLHRPFVREQHVGVVANAVVDVAGHVVEMRFTRQERHRGERVRVAERAFRRVDHFFVVDAQVQRADLIRIECERGVEVPAEIGVLRARDARG